MLTKKNVAIIEADFGNIASIINAIKYLGYEFEAVKSPINLESFSHLILPGVGSYNKAAEKLQSLGWYEAIKNFANLTKPVLGICLGMQLMFEEGNEHGLTEGLKFFKGKCTEFSNNNKFPLPHMGFNFVKHNKKIYFCDNNFYNKTLYSLENQGSDNNIMGALYKGFIATAVFSILILYPKPY